MASAELSRRAEKPVPPTSARGPPLIDRRGSVDAASSRGLTITDAELATRPGDGTVFTGFYVVFN